jgi:AmiR/NasT family two-component response regulator
MERHHIDEDRALQFLMRASSNSNVKLRVIADQVVATSTEGYPTTTAAL